jgi:hypothetical protein
LSLNFRQCIRCGVWTCPYAGILHSRMSRNWTESIFPAANSRAGTTRDGKKKSRFCSKTRRHCPQVHYNVHVLIVLPKLDPFINAVLIVKHEQIGSKLVNRRSPCSMSSRPCLRRSHRPRRLPRKRRRYGLWQSDYKKTNRNPRRKKFRI